MTHTARAHGREPSRAIERGWSYTRVSDDKGGLSASIPEQDDEIAEDVEAAFPGAAIERRYSDPDRSASRFARKTADVEPERPEWRRLERDLTTLRPPDFICFWESSRGSREMGPWVRFLDTCRKYGILLRFVDDRRTYDPGNAADRETLLQQGIKSEAASEQTSARVRRDLRAAARKGRPHGDRLYGYTKVFDYRGRLTAVVPNEAEKVIVEEIYFRIARSESPGRICADLNARGILPPRAAAAARELETCDDPARRVVLEQRITGKQWKDAPIRLIVLNRAYTGERVHKGEVVGTAMWKPIVGQALAAQARAVVAGRRLTKERPGRFKYLLTWIAECGVCHELLQCLAAGRTRAAASYTCPNSGRHAARHVDLLDAYLTEAVIARLADPDLLRQLGVGDDTAREIQEALTAAAEKEQRLQAAISSHARTSKPSLAAVSQMEEELLPLIQRDRERARRLSVQPLLEGLTGPEELVRPAWEALQLSQQREVVRLLVQRIELFPAGSRGRRRPLRETVKIRWRGEPDPEPAG